MLVRAPGVRAFEDGFVSVLLSVYVTTLGYNAIHRAVATATLLGSTMFTLTLGLIAVRR